MKIFNVLRRQPWLMIELVVFLALIGLGSWHLPRRWGELAFSDVAAEIALCFYGSLGLLIWLRAGKGPKATNSPNGEKSPTSQTSSSRQAWKDTLWGAVIAVGAFLVIFFMAGSIFYMLVYGMYCAGLPITIAIAFDFIISLLLAWKEGCSRARKVATH